MTKHSKRARKAVPVLALLIPLAAIISICMVSTSMSMNNWLHSYERIPISNSSNAMEEFIIKRTISGLWFLCAFDLTERQIKAEIDVAPELMNCSSIEYFGKDKYISDPNDSTNAIRFAVTKAGPLFVVASLLLSVGVIAAIFGYQRHRRIALFVSGIFFVVSGLMLLIGLVVYLSALQSEIGTKLRPRNSVDLPQFSYKYGFSFMLVVFGFMATEMTGILAIFYYIYWHQLDWTQKLGSKSESSQSINIQHGAGNGKSPFRCTSQFHQSSSKYNIMDAVDGHKESHKSKTKYSSHSSYLMGKDVTDFEIPFPPPPPHSSAYLSMPRDFTTLTSCSDEDGSVFFPPPPPPSQNSATIKGGKEQRSTTTV